MRLLMVIFSVVFMSGCLVSTYKVEKPRVDIDHSKGNRGYIFGTPKAGAVNTLGETREVAIVEVEYGTGEKAKKKKKTKEERRQEKLRKKQEKIERKKALKEKKRKSRIPTYVRPVEPVSVIDDEISRADDMEQDIEIETIDINTMKSDKAGFSSDEIYVIKKGDTLQKISSKFYGTTKKWKMLYQENTDVLKGPDKIYPGLKIRIPAVK